MAATAVETVNRARVKSMVVPREHGAWGLLLVPLVTGAAIGLLDGGHSSGQLALFSLAALALFWLRTPVESLLGTSPFRPGNESERHPVMVAAVVLAAFAALCLTALFWGGNHRQLLLIGGVAALAFVMQAGLKKLGRQARTASQMVGVIGLTATGPAAYYVACGRLDTQALAIWLANWMFAAGQIQFVQLRIHAARCSELREKWQRGRGFAAGQVAILAALLGGLAGGMFPALVLAAFVPALARGARWFFRAPQPLAVRALGWWEVAQSVTFGLLLIVAFSN